MKALKENRAVSFVFVFIVYLIATALGILTYRSLSYAWWLSLLIADVVATVLVFAFSLLLKNASVYDPYWSVQPPVILAALALGSGINAYGILLLSVVSLWAIRLTANWAYTFADLTHEDWRYRMLKENTGAFYPLINFVGIHMVPTLVVYACILPAAYAIKASISTNVFGVLFLAVSLLAVLLQGVSDAEMHKYRKKRDGAFNRHGLWKYSRHPNYLAEILMWWGVALSVVFSAEGAWHLLLGALLNTALFLFVSIPMAEKRQSKKEGYAEYKKQTRMLLPIKK